jgi:hypothetical protein
VPEPLDPQRCFAALERRGVEYVLIGGLAAVLHGSAVVTNDADICPSRARENLERLSVALRDLHARIRTPTDPDGVAFACEPALLERVQMLNLQTDAGNFDIAFEPAGFTGYDDLVQGAETFDIDGILVRVAALRDVIRSKENANRAKDRAALPHLYALEDEIAAHDND